MVLSDRITTEQVCIIKVSHSLIIICREKYGINLVIVLDGLTPKYLSEKNKILEKSKNVWAKLTYNDSNENLKIEMIKNYGVRYYHQEIVCYKAS